MSQLQSLTLPALRDNIRRYRERGVTTGGHFTLSELLQEERRRSPQPFPTVAVAMKILEQARDSSDGLTSYKALWDAFTEQAWQGNASARKIGTALGHVIAYCARHGLPVITTLVVQHNSRKLDEKAVHAIYNEAKEYGFDAGLDPYVFVEHQQHLSRKVSVGQIDEANVI